MALDDDFFEALRLAKIAIDDAIFYRKIADPERMLISAKQAHTRLDKVINKQEGNLHSGPCYHGCAYGYE